MVYACSELEKDLQAQHNKLSKSYKEWNSRKNPDYNFEHQALNEKNFSRGVAIYVHKSWKYRRIDISNIVGAENTSNYTRNPTLKW